MKKALLMAIIVVAVLIATAILLPKDVPKDETITTTTENSTTEPITEDLEEKTTKDTTEEEKPSEGVVEPKTSGKPKPTQATSTQVFIPSPELVVNDTDIEPQFFRKTGKIYADGYWWTWYSERVLPGGGLDIPGRWSDGNYVRDEDGYIVMAHETLPMGTIVDSPFGEGKIYDRCETPEVVDVYTSW